MYVWSLAVDFVQHLKGLASWLPPEAGMFMWMQLGGGVKDADDIIDALKDEQVAVVPGCSPHFAVCSADTLSPAQSRADQS